LFNDGVYDVMWKNILEPNRPQMTIWCTCFACGTTEATNTHSVYVILIVLTLQQWLHERASLLRYNACLCVCHNKLFE